MATDFEVLAPGGHARLVEDVLAITDAKADAKDLVALSDIVLGSAMEVDDWDEVALAANDQDYFLVGARLSAPWSTTGTTKTDYEMPWDIAHTKVNEVYGGSTMPLMYLQTHHCLPDATEFSPKQAFLYAIDGLPAGTYNLTVSATTYGRDAGTYQFTLTQALPAGGQLAGFFDAGAAASVKAYASQVAASATETCTVTSGSAGTNLGTWSSAGVAVPASGTPESHETVTIDGQGYTYYGINAQSRVSYGNNRWLHSPLRQWLNASGDNWWSPATVFDRPPSYVSHKGFLTYLDPGLIAVMQPVKRTYALNYATDGGTSSAPVYDTCYDKVFLPCWEENYLKVDSSYGGKAGEEGCGEAWEYWRRAKGTSTPPAAGTTNTEYIRTRLDNKTAAGVFLASASRNYGNYVACVTSTGTCGYYNAFGACRAAPACAIGKSE